MLFFTLLILIFISNISIMSNRNKQEHILLSSLIVFTSLIFIKYFLYMSIAVVESSVIVSICIGIAKEVISKILGNTFSTLNIQAYVLGSILGVFQYTIYFSYIL